MENLMGNHDLPGLPEWGPYTKKYMGISHLANSKRGLRFDLSVFPGFYRRKVDIPNVRWESGYHPWEASVDLSYYSHRHELEWKDRVYADIAFAQTDPDTRVIRCRFANRTEAEQNVVLHYMASLHFPQIGSDGKWLHTSSVILPDGAMWQDALDYDQLHFAIPRAYDHLVYDGFYRAEERISYFVGGSGVGCGFGSESGDQVEYLILTDSAYSDGVMALRYKMENGGQTKIAVSIDGGDENTVILSGNGGIKLASIPIGQLSPGEHRIRLESQGGSSLALDGFVMVERTRQDQISFPIEPTSAQPQILPGPKPNSLLLQYDGLEQVYGLLWTCEDFEVREFQCDDLDDILRYAVHNHVKSKFKGQGDGHYSNIFMRPIALAPHSDKTLYGMICAGNVEEVTRRLALFDESEALYAKYFAEAEKKAVQLPHNPDGTRFLFSQQLMSATLLSNVVYPVYTKRAYIRHNTPGRWWDCLYTWDSGFIGLGLAELDIARAIECLNAYVTEPGDPHAAFIHHGSLVPVQHYLFLELWNKTRSKELLDYFYPRLRQYYLYYVGKAEGSVTRNLKSGLLQPWEYFYNSGGWDDYPPQVHVHQNHLARRTAPVSNTCHAIRIAKILKMAAHAIGGLEEHEYGYDEDIASLTASIQKHAWDEESGYFGYVIHDENGWPQELLRHQSGQNFNMGLDGAYPLIAGICRKDQEDRILYHIADPSKLWSSIGLTTVDQSAAYFTEDGYWNGAVWMPHQWFYWKALLGSGHAEVAHRIAQTALELWENEVEQTYNCYEHFITQTGRGAGWHHFGGLSAPVLCWYSAYHRPGTITCGYDVWLEQVEFAEKARGMSAVIRYYGTYGNRHTVLVCLCPGIKYWLKWEGAEVLSQEIADGVYEVHLVGEEQGTLQIYPINERPA